MDDTLQELENELKRLSPRGPSAALHAALECDLGAEKPAPASLPYTSATSLRSWKWASWSLVGAAALVAFAFAVQSARQPSAGPLTPSPAPAVAATSALEKVPSQAVVEGSNRYQPVHATSVLYDLHEGNTTTLPDRTEGREVRYRYVDTYTWKNPATNASLRWSVPRDEVRLVRANLD
jgi:hypothetical protein